MENMVKEYIEYLEQRIERAKSPAEYSDRVDVYIKAKEYLVNEAEEIGADFWESVSIDETKSNWRLPNTNELFTLLDNDPDIEKKYILVFK